jgi:hypothetical protein
MSCHFTSSSGVQSHRKSFYCHHYLSDPRMAYGHYLFILLASVCLFGQISAESNYTSVVSAFDNRYNASNPYALELSYQFPTKHAVFYQLIFNVTDATFVDLSNIAVLYTNLPPTYHNLVISSVIIMLISNFKN